MIVKFLNEMLNPLLLDMYKDLINICFLRDHMASQITDIFHQESVVAFQNFTPTPPPSLL